MADEAVTGESSKSSEITFDNRQIVKDTLSQIPKSELNDADIKKLTVNPSKNIPEGSVILDIGCGNGATGIVMAAESNSSLIQADFHDVRTYKVGDLVKTPMVVPGTEAPNFEKPLADVAMLIDVTTHTGYGNGWNQEKREPDKDGRTEDLLKLLNGISTAVKPDGFILVANTRDDGKKDLQYLREYIAKNPGLEQKIKVLG